MTYTRLDVLPAEFRFIIEVPGLSLLLHKN